LHGAYIIAALEEVGGEGVAEGVGGDVFGGDTGQFGGSADGFLEAAFVGMVAAGFVREGVNRQVFSREDVLPGPFTGSVGVFVGEGVGQVDGSVAFFDVLLVNLLDAGQVFAQGRDEAFGEHGDAVFFAFAIANDDAVLFEVYILDAQTQAFDEAQAGAVEDFGHELVSAGEGVEDAQGFVFGEDGGDVFGFLGADSDGVFEGFAQDFTVEEEDGAEGLVLGGGGDFALGGEVGDVGFDFGVAHVPGVALVVE